MLKYYYLCVTGENPEQEIRYDELESVYHDSQLLLIARRVIKNGTSSHMTYVEALTIVRDYPKFWNHIQSIGYQLRMV
jgi:hypothetical protein